MFNKYFLIFISIIGYQQASFACNDSKISSYTRMIDPASSNSIQYFNVALRALSQCEDRGFAAGLNLGMRVDPYYSTSSWMAKSIIENVDSFPSDFAKGLSFGLIVKVNLGLTNTIDLLHTIGYLGRQSPNDAESIAENLMIKFNSSYEINDVLIRMVEFLNKVAEQYKNDESDSDSGMSSYWTFKEYQIQCQKNNRHSWNRCFRFTASTVDDLGNEISFTCSTEQSSVSLRIHFADSSWRKIKNNRVKMFGIGTSNGIQNLSYPNIDSQLKTFESYQTIAEDILSDLMRLNETMFRVNFQNGSSYEFEVGLSGSSRAIQQLKNRCQ